MQDSRPLSQRLDRCYRMNQNESRYPNGGNVRLFSAAMCMYVTMQITFHMRKYLPIRFAPHV